jgi:methionine sulfoxide reductase heme-binding subunit
VTAPAFAGHEWWLASRAAGVVAVLLVSASVGLGLANAARLSPPRARRRLLAFHEQTALAALISIAAHGLLLLPDRWLHPGPAGITVPLAIGYRPAATALGIIGGYLAAILGLSFYVRRRIGPRLWRRLHMATLAVYALALAHTLTAGTDAGTTWLRVVIATTAAPIVVLLGMRLVRRPAGARAAGRSAA